MAFSATTNWEVRTTGSDTNGGGFDVASTGTDHSQSNTPLFAYTDIVIVTTTTMTSVARPFVAADVGNILNVTSGTGFTVQRVQITAVNASTHVATVDKSLGTAASTGGTGNLGGGLATPAIGIPLMDGGNVTWIQTGSYSQSTLITLANISNTQFYINGYQTTHGDNGTAPTLTQTANGTALLSLGAGSTNMYFLNNLALASTASTKSNGLVTSTGSGNIVVLTRLSLANFSNGVLGQTGLGGGNVAFLSMNECAVTGCSSNGLEIGGPFSISTCYFASNTGFHVTSSTGEGCVITGSIFANGGTSAISLSAITSFSITISNCTIAGNSGNGVLIGTGWTVGTLIATSNIIYGNTVWGINVTSSRPFAVYTSNNAYGANTSGNRNNIAAGIGDVTLTASPFVGSPNFALNSTSGGGAACKAVGYPGTFPGGTTTGFDDIGAAQSAASGAVSNYGYTG